MEKKVCFVLILIVRAALAQAQATETINVQSKVFHEVRKVKVSLPPGYNDYPYRKYIVAYLFDAQSDDFFNYIKATIDYLTAEGYIKPLILVGISSGNRQYEFTPKSETEQGVKYFQKSGGADLLALHLEDEVLPYIQKRFRCNSYNIGIGHSLGATFVTYCLMRYPEIFNATIAISPNFHYDNEQIVHKFDSLANKQSLFNKFLYIAYGKDDTYEERFKPGTQKMDSLLIRKDIAGLKWQVKSLDNDSHGTTAAEGIFKGLLALYRQFTLSDKQIDSFYKDSKTSFIDNVKEYYKSQSGWAGIQLPIVDDINNIGYNCMYAGKNKDAIEVFTWALSLYPDDTNLYDSMGEVQQNAGNKKAALYYYSKGVDIVKQQKSKMQIKTYEERIKWFNGRIQSVNNPK